MSAVLIRREVHVAFTSHECGKEFGGASADVQAWFLAGMLDAIREFSTVQSWPQQCRLIASEIKEEDRSELIVAIKTLLEQLSP